MFSKAAALLIRHNAWMNAIRLQSPLRARQSTVLSVANSASTELARHSVGNIMV